MSSPLAIIGIVHLRLTHTLLLGTCLMVGTAGFCGGQSRHQRVQCVARNRVGRQMAAEVEKQARLVDDPIVAEYINRLGQNLAQQAKSRISQVTVKMIDVRRGQRIHAAGTFCLPELGSDEDGGQRGGTGVCNRA